MARVNAPKSVRKRRFRPFVAPKNVPAGLYDPQLDSQERAGSRGLEDLRQDTEKYGTRSSDDYLLAQGDLNRARQEGEQDFGFRSQDLDFRQQDLERRGVREGQDYGTSVANLDRSYGRLANSQAQRFRASGLRGGALLQAAQKRTANQALDKAPIDLSHTRFGEDQATDLSRLGTARERLGIERERALGEGGDIARRLGALGVSYGRDVEDRGTGLTRAEREQNFLSQDVQQSRLFQATQAGYVPPSRPAGEHGTGANAYRLQRINGRLVEVTPDGRVRPRRRRR